MTKTITIFDFRRGIVTDEERLQMEYDSKYVSAQQTPMLVQPLSSSNNKFGVPVVSGSDPKPYNNAEVRLSCRSFDFCLIFPFFLFQIDPSLNNAAAATSGVYRQRSYDNLQNNGKFNNNSSFKIKKSASTVLPSSSSSASTSKIPPSAIAATIQTATTNTQTMLSPINNNNMTVQTSPIQGTLPLNYSYYTPQITSYNSNASTNANLSSGSGSGTDTDGGGSSSTSKNHHHRSNNLPLTTLPRYLYQKNRGMPFVSQCTNNENYRSSRSSSSSTKIYKNDSYHDFDEFESTLFNNNNNNEIVATHFSRGGSECEPMLRNTKKYYSRASFHNNSKKGISRRDSGTIVQQKYPNSPYVSRKRHHRHSNVYDYRTTTSLNYDLNAINEDGVNET